MYYQIFNIIAPALLCATIGYFWGKSTHDFNTQLVSRLVFTVGVPCLIIGKLGNLEIDPKQLSETFFATLLILLATALTAFSFCKLSGINTKDYSLALVFPNNGNMGLPLAYFAFGEQGLAIALVVLVTTMVFHNTLGIAYISKQTSMLRSLNSPIIYATVLALIMITTGWQLPTWADNTVGLLADFPIPLMLIMLGVSLAQLKITDLPLSTLLSITRLVIGFACGWLVTTILGIEGYMQAVIILLSSMPVAVFNYLLAAQYQRAATGVAGCVVVSTLLSFLTLPWLLKFLMGS